MVTPDLLFIRFAENVPSAKAKQSKERKGEERRKGGEGLKKFQI
jgi:hypothetical protein